MGKLTWFPCRTKGTSTSCPETSPSCQLYLSFHTVVESSQGQAQPAHCSALAGRWSGRWAGRADGGKPLASHFPLPRTPSWAQVRFHWQLVAASPKQVWPIPLPLPFLIGPLTAVRTSQQLRRRPPPQLHPREMPHACARVVSTPLFSFPLPAGSQ